MSFEHGTLVQWNDERGFGFIKPDQENSQVFVHIKAFGPLARRPVVGDRIWFDSAIGEQGKRKATTARITEGSTNQEAPVLRTDPSTRRPKVSRPLTGSRNPNEPSDWSSRPRRNSGIRGFRNRLKPVMLTIALSIGGITWLSSKCSSSEASAPTPTEQNIPTSNVFDVTPSTSFQCTGKQHCSQMSSKEEAQFYLAHCPNVMMDGDGDGDACEEQFGR